LGRVDISQNRKKKMKRESSKKKKTKRILYGKKPFERGKKGMLRGRAEDIKKSEEH
jgi:hypothetical protein